MATTISGIQAKKDFLGIDNSTREALIEFTPAMAEHLPAILDVFYDLARAWPDLSKLVGDDQNVVRLKGAQTEHWMALFSGTFDEGYLARATRIGKTHERIGLEPSWYMGGYCKVLGALAGVAVDRYRKQPERCAQILTAVIQAVFMDMDVSLSVYQEEMRATHQKKLDELARSLEAGVKAVAETLAAASTELQSSSESLAQTADRSNQQASAVAAASERASTNVQTVATAADQLSSSINEISRQVNDSAKIAQDAVDAATQANGTVQGLAEAAQKIGDVVNLINDIASQTNLLALNATIEAARAGDAGKGFAVVASEVKNLAKQTAKATEEISAQIGDMQSATSSAVGAIEGVGQKIGEMSQIATAIAGAVDQQNAATSEISRNVEEAAQGVQDVTSNISGVMSSASETDQAANHIVGAAKDLSHQSGTLNEVVETFIGQLRAS